MDLAPATLFTGTAASGAETRAIDLARQILGPKILGAAYRQLHPDFLLIEPENETIKIEAIREIGRRLSIQPLEGTKVVVLIREADRMTEAAANALLKTLEEPPPYAIFLLVSAVPERLPATIRSRCRRISAAEPPREELRGRFAPLFGNHQETLAKLLGRSSFSAASALAETIAPDQIRGLLDLLKAWWHDIAALEQTGDEKFLLFPEAVAPLKAWLKKRSGERIFNDVDLLLESERALEGNVNKTLLLERLFFKLMQSEDGQTADTP